MNKKKIIFTDLDESLLNQNKYNAKILDKFIKGLIKENYSIVAITSKTFSEVTKLFKLNNIQFPFSTENGALFTIPYSKSNKKLSFMNKVNNKAIKTSRIMDILSKLSSKYLKNISFIKDLNVDQQIKITNLKKEEIFYFNNRNFSVSIIWKGSNISLERFKKEISRYDLHILFGGKVLNISGCHTKLDAIKYFEKYYSKKLDISDFITVSIGDSNNDIEMLNYTDYSGVVKREDKKKIDLKFSNNIYFSTKYAPEGWVELVKLIKKKMENSNS